MATTATLPTRTSATRLHPDLPVQAQALAAAQGRHPARNGGVMKLTKHGITEIGTTIRDAATSTPKTSRLILIVAAVILTASVGCSIQTVTVTITHHQ